jgi:peptidoglycan/xylan/chitin deacetylase (PgdA/CDA1 family)
LLGGVVRWRGIVVLNYHRIGDGTRSTFDRGLFSATQHDFEAHVRFLKANFDVISPRDIRYVLRVRRGRHVLVTFDDGYADNYEAAFPVLAAHNVPASFFVATGFIDEPRLPWWDEIAWMVRTSRRAGCTLPAFLPAPLVFDEPEREAAVRALLRVYKRLPSERAPGYLDAVAAATGTGRAPPEVASARGCWMTWAMLREMHAAGMTIGGHTTHHPILSRMTREGQSREVASCAERIREELGVPMRAFAYPVGSRDAFNADTRACLREQGVSFAFSYYGGFRSLGRWDDYDIPRLAVEPETSRDELRAMLACPWAA